MEKKELVINKDNYKGYVELYKKNLEKDKYYDEAIIPYIKKALFGFGIFLLIGAPIATIINTNLVLAFAMLTIGYESLVMINFSKKYDKVTQQQKNEVKEKYPYVDIDIEFDELVKVLKDNYILTETGELMVKWYEKLLLFEEVKEKYLEETKYTKYEVDSSVQQVELDKPKVKKLVK